MEILLLSPFVQNVQTHKNVKKTTKQKQQWQHRKKQLSVKAELSAKS